ncbi:Scr1 family TA system antitoxin-like transcriptional regulator [Saccharopolyspora pogona]|uniref:Scr1 family TA system antitoxin-like transcriptional regulator n=1 Tax=Saccharopolyspora pogona TaxID=333966 RepID=UPI001CC220EE|nr:Scr1 family TA system antitoxin-like transcriptional regulator [Saccharopolyspora pogona]
MAVPGAGGAGNGHSCVVRKGCWPQNPPWHPAHMGSFIVFEFPKASPIVHMEHYRSSVSLHNSGIANAYKDAVISLHELAMPPEASVEFIARRADELEAAA